MLLGMETKTVKTKINKLLARESGPKLAKYAAVARRLHITPRHVIYLSKGEKRASFHLSLLIDQLLTD